MRIFKFRDFDPSKLNVTYTDDFGGLTSREMAKCFGVRHRDVLSEVERIRKIFPKYLFTYNPYLASNGKKYPEWFILWDAFFLMVTNPQESDVKTKYENVRKLVSSQNSPIKENIEILLNTYIKD